MRGEAAAIELSIIIPAYNEEDSVEPLYHALVAAVPEIGCAFEVILVDDGSTDDTFQRLAAIARRDPRFRVIKLRRNHGQTPAMAAGIDHARGAVLVTMDADLQNDPADIERLLAKIREGYDLVVGWRRNRQDKWLSRKLPSRLANRLIAWLTGVSVQDNGCTLKAFRAELIKSMPLYSEMHRFLPALLSMRGCRLAELEVRHHARRFGVSKYGLSRTYRVCLDLIGIKILLTFTRRPLLCFFGTAAVTFVSSLAFGAFTLYLALAGASSIVVFMAVSILLGSLAMFLALAGVIISLVHQQSIAAAGTPALTNHAELVR